MAYCDDDPVDSLASETSSDAIAMTINLSHELYRTPPSWVADDWWVKTEPHLTNYETFRITFSSVTSLLILRQLEPTFTVGLQKLIFAVLYYTINSYFANSTTSFSCANNLPILRKQNNQLLSVLFMFLSVSFIMQIQLLANSFHNWITFQKRGMGIGSSSMFNYFLDYFLWYLSKISDFLLYVLGSKTQFLFQFAAISLEN